MTVPGEIPRYPAISAAEKLSTPLSTPMTRVRVRLRGVFRNNAAGGIPAAASAAVAAAAIRLTPSRSEDVRCVFNPSSTKRWYERSEEHTSELQSLTNLVCRLLLEKKKKKSTRKEMNITSE